MSDRPKSFLITGGCGFIGSNLVRFLLEQGHFVFNIDALTYAGNLDSLVDIEEHERYDSLRADISEGKKIAKAFRAYKPDYVIHLAAETHVDRSISRPLDFVRTNVLGTAALLQVALDHWVARGEPADFRFLHVSTDEVFGELGGKGCFTETSSYAPRSPYSASKASADHMVRAWGNTYGLPVILANCTNNYGPFQFPEKLIPQTILNAICGKRIPVYGKGEQVRDWLHVSDHCRALECIARGGKVGETYLVGAGCERRNIDLVGEICELVDDFSDGFPELGLSGNTGSLIEFVKDRPGHDFRYAVDSSKLRNELGWQPEIEMKVGLRETVRWYLENSDWWSGILDGSYRDI